LVPITDNIQVRFIFPLPAAISTLLFALGAALGALCNPLPGACETPVPADSVTDSIGINIHLHFQNTIYGNFPLIEGLLKNLGVRHTRDGLIDTTWQPYYDRHIALGKLGIRSIFVTTPNESDELLTSWPKRVPGAFEGYEAPNELDNSRDANWAQTLSDFMPRLYRAVKSDPATARYPVIGPSLIHPQDYSRLPGIVSDFDLANLHNYFSGRNPGTEGWGANGYGSIAYNIKLAASVWPDKPIVTTETGYYTDAGHDSLPEHLEGEYVPRLVLEQLLHGIQRTYFYELIDENGTAQGNEGYFGLAHADGSPKPAYLALKNLIALFADPGPPVHPKNLDFSLNGAPGSVHHLLTAKRDGSYYLALWIESQNYDVNKKAETPSAPVQIRLTSPQAFRSADEYQFDSEGNVKQTSVTPGASIPLTVSERLLVVRLR
jgi:hypothetical protein